MTDGLNFFSLLLKSINNYINIWGSEFMFWVAKTLANPDGLQKSI